MKRIKVEIYVSHFVATVLDKTLMLTIDKFARPYQTYKLEFNRGLRKKVRVPDKPYYIFEPSEMKWTFHISLLKLFISTLGYYSHLTSDQIEVENYSKEDYGLPADIQFRNDQFTLRDYQKVVTDELTQPENYVKLVPTIMGSGKELRNGTRIRVPNGWRAIENLQVGDYVIHPSGNPTKVTGVFPQGKKKLYKFVFLDGRTIDAGLEHQWLIYRSDGTEAVLTTKQILLEREKPENKDLKHYIPLPEPEVTEDKELPLDPFILGVILTSNISNGIIINTDDSDYVDLIASKLPETSKLTRKIIINKVYNEYRLTSTEFSYMAKLKELGITKESLFIPEVYYNASIEQKTELLRALFNNAIAINAPDSTAITLTLDNEDLAKSVQKLVRSVGDIVKLVPYGLGYKLFIKSKKPNRYFYGTKFKAPTNPLRLRILDIVEVDKDEATCISVEAEDQLYVADNYIVTHNTLMCCYALSKIAKKAAIVILPKYIDKWKEDMDKHFYNIKDKYCVIQGSEKLKDLMLHPNEYNSKYDIFIFSLRTLSLYVNIYDNRKRDNFESEQYPVAPEDLMQLLGIGVMVSDESHQEMCNVSKLMLYFKVSKYILLTATLASNDKHTQFIYDMVVPDANIVKVNLNTNNHIDVNNIRYFIEDANRKVKHTGSQGYSQITFEQYLFSRPHLLSQYDKMILKYVERDYIKRRKDGQKLLIYCSLVDMCKHFCNLLRGVYPDLTINTYVEEDDYESIMESDITVSTPLSASTGIDIPNLITVIQTISMGSLQSNRQSMGRLRKIDGVSTIYDAFYCGSLRKHNDLYRQRESCTIDIAKSWKKETYAVTPEHPAMKILY